MQADHRIEAKMKTSIPKVSTFEQAVASWPIFGGTSPEGGGDTITAGGDGTVTIEGKIVDKDKSSGGDDGKAGEDIVNPADPDAIAKITAQLEAAKKAAETATATANQYKQKEEQAARAQQTKEEQLQADLDNAQATIQQQDAVIKNSALTNALLSQKDFEWHSVRQVMAELQDEEITVDVDYESGQAVVSGIENAAKRIAKDCPWLVSKNKAEQQNPANTTNSNGTKVRPSGTPPRPPSNQVEKTQRRAELSKRFPVISR